MSMHEDVAPRDDDVAPSCIAKSMETEPLRIEPSEAVGECETEAEGEGSLFKLVVEKAFSVGEG